MCGRYTIKDPVALATQIAHLTGEPFEVVAARYNITPSQLNPVVRPRKNGKPAATVMKWGFTPHWQKAGKTAAAHANARSEDMFTRATFKAAVQERRCAVPADGFYEWRRVDEHTRLPHHFCLRSRAPFFIAGLFTEGDATTPPTYALLTTGPNALMAPIHDRMPVMLAGAALDRWLAPGPIADGEARELCHPFAADQMEEWPVDRRVNSPRNDDPACVAPAAEPPPGPTQGLLF